MADRLEVRLHDELVGWIARSSRRERIEFEWVDGFAPGPVTLTESFGSVRLKAPSAEASNFFGGYALEGRQRERLTERRGIANPTDLYLMLREFGSSIAGAVTIGDPLAARGTEPRYEPISDGEIIQRLRRAASDGDLGSDDQSRSMLAGYQPKLLLARFDDLWFLPRGRAHSTHILKPRLVGRPDGLAREHYGHALAAELGLAHYRTELIGRGARQYLVIERYDRAVNGETVTLIHQEDAAQALGLDWVDENAKFQNPDAPRDSHRPSAYRIAELLGSLQGEGHPVADFLRRLTFTVLLGDNDAHAKNLAVLHLPGRSVLADVYDAVPSLFQKGRISHNLALAIDGSFDHRCISAAHLVREAERWNALGVGEADRIVTSTLADFAKALDNVVVPPGIEAAVTAQLAWNLERLQAGHEIGERPSGYRRKRRSGEKNRPS
ncbi:MAG TPA: HipA domain-containing protein [Streptosporangiaceae bacterium]|nr:HipA domain-containing protein [Streptosporangiaceae bacterium]